MRLPPEPTGASSTSEPPQRPPRRRPRSTIAGSGTLESLEERCAGPDADVHRSGSIASGTRTRLTRNRDSDRPCGAFRSPGTIAPHAGAWEKSNRSVRPEPIGQSAQSLKSSRRPRLCGWLTLPASDGGVPRDLSPASSAELLRPRPSTLQPTESPQRHRVWIFSSRHACLTGQAGCHEQRPMKSAIVRG